MIKIVELTKKYADKVVLDNLSLEFHKGKVYGVFGKSGTGKSTLLNIIGQIEAEYEGEVIIDGKPTRHLRRKNREKIIANNISYLFQNYALIDEDTVEENLKLVIDNKNDSNHLMREALREVGLDSNLLKMPVHTLSGGEQQRVALARSILKKGNILLADEPTGNLDVENGHKIFKILKNEAHKKNQCVIIVSHDLEIIQQCDETIELD